MDGFNEIIAGISANLDLKITLGSIVEAVEKLIPCALVEVGLWDEKTQLLTTQAIRCEPARQYPIGQTYPAGEGYTGWIVRNCQPLLVPDVDKHPEGTPHILPGELPFKAYAGVPLLFDDELLGALVVVSNETGAFNQEDLQLLMRFADHAAIAIQNARVHEELSRRHKELAAIHAVSSIINQPLPLEQILDRAVSKVVEVMCVDAGGIRLLDRDANELVVISSVGLSSEYIKAVDRIKFGEGAVGKVVATGEILIVEDLANDTQISNPAAAAAGFRTFVVVPLNAKEEVIGTLGVVTRQVRDFSVEELELLTSIGSQIGIAIENSRLREEAIAAERMVAIGQAATSVAHELRGPLGGILRSAEFLDRPEISPETRKKLSQSIVSLSRRLINKSQEILDFVRGDKILLVKSPCVLTDFLNETLSVLEVDFSDQGIEVIKDYHYHGSVLIDQDRMAQVIFNIAVNARDAMINGGTFRVSTKVEEDSVEMAFSDTGVGIPAELGDKVFKPYVTFGKRGGVGLGLTIARSIVEDHGGTIKFISGAAGTTFIIILPR
jgi:signal transduction histidine kinase